MEAEKRKRKLLLKEEEEDDDDNEKEKMEEFFALIRSTREIRDRLRSSFNGSKEKEEKKKKKKTEGDKGNGIWNPTFRPEDFLVDGKRIVVGVSQAEAGPSSNQEPGKGDEEKDHKEEGKGDKGIDLNLCL